MIGEVVGTELDQLQELVEANRLGPKSAEMEEEEEVEDEDVADPRWPKIYEA